MHPARRADAAQRPTAKGLPVVALSAVVAIGTPVAVVYPSSRWFARRRDGYAGRGGLPVVAIGTPVSLSAVVAIGTTVAVVYPSSRPMGGYP